MTVVLATTWTLFVGLWYFPDFLVELVAAVKTCVSKFRLGGPSSCNLGSHDCEKATTIVSRFNQMWGTFFSTPLDGVNISPTAQHAEWPEG